MLAAQRRSNAALIRRVILLLHDQLNFHSCARLLCNGVICTGKHRLQVFYCRRRGFAALYNHLCNFCTTGQHKAFGCRRRFDRNLPRDCGAALLCDKAVTAIRDIFKLEHTVAAGCERGAKLNAICAVFHQPHGGILYFFAVVVLYYIAVHIALVALCIGNNQLCRHSRNAGRIVRADDAIIVAFPLGLLVQGQCCFGFTLQLGPAAHRAGCALVPLVKNRSLARHCFYSKVCGHRGGNSSVLRLLCNGNTVFCRYLNIAGGRWGDLVVFNYNFFGHFTATRQLHCNGIRAIRQVFKFVMPVHFRRLRVLAGTCRRGKCHGCIFNLLPVCVCNIALHRDQVVHRRVAYGQPCYCRSDSICPVCLYDTVIIANTLGIG